MNRRRNSADMGSQHIGHKESRDYREEMPELPEVETIRRQLEPELRGRIFTAADSHWSSKFTPALDAVGAMIERIGRRGKYLIFVLDDGHELIAHLGMTGQFSITQAGANTGPQCSDHGTHVRALWTLDDERQLVYRDVRRFGRLHVVQAGDYRAIATLHQMGPEPLGDQFSGEHLHAAVSKSSRAIKTQLLSQRPVAGVGNIYADEALFLARINPKATRVGRSRCDLLAQTIQHVLSAGIQNGGTTLRDYVHVDGGGGSNQHALQIYGRGGQPCLACARPLRTTTLDGRTTTYCGTCQRH